VNGAVFGIQARKAGQGRKRKLDDKEGTEQQHVLSLYQHHSQQQHEKQRGISNRKTTGARKQQEKASY
jgi:hypothetical protein